MTTPEILRDALRHLMVAHGTLETTTRPCGTPLPAPRAHALLELLNSQTSPSITELAQTLGMERTTCSRMCQRMEAAGELTRLAHPTDGRTNLLALTVQGRVLAERVDTASATHFARVLNALPSARHADVLIALNVLTQTISTLPKEAP